MYQSPLLSSFFATKVTFYHNKINNTSDTLSTIHNILLSPPPPLSDDLATSSLIRWRLLNRQHAAHYPSFFLFLWRLISSISPSELSSHLSSRPPPITCFYLIKKKQKTKITNRQVSLLIFMSKKKSCSINYAFFSYKTFSITTWLQKQILHRECLVVCWWIGWQELIPNHLSSSSWTTIFSCLHCHNLTEHIEVHSFSLQPRSYKAFFQPGCLPFWMQKCHIQKKVLLVIIANSSINPLMSIGFFNLKANWGHPDLPHKQHTKEQTEKKLKNRRNWDLDDQTVSNLDPLSHQLMHVVSMYTTHWDTTLTESLCSKIIWIWTYTTI